MKLASKIFSLAIATTLMASACKQSASTDGGDNQNTPQYHPTTDAAVAKAKADLLSVLEIDKTINLGIEASALRDAQPGKAITYSAIDFDKLAALDSLTDVSKVVKSVNATLVPLVNQGNVVTVVEINKEDKGWKVTGLGNAEFSRNLQALFTQPQNGGDAEIQLFEVPNLKANLYVVKSQGKELYYTDYEGYSIRQSVNPADLLTRLKSDAEIFIKNYGSALKDGKLVE